jgi:hypothetical protein
MTTSTRHLRQGWWALFIFLTLGLGLETLHGFKIGWYLDADADIRRLMFTLSHAHGTLLALVNIAVGLTLRCVEGFDLQKNVSGSLIWGSMVLPIGFLLGGLFIHDGDPGLGVFLVPIGGFMLLYGVGCAAKELSKQLKP